MNQDNPPPSQTIGGTTLMNIFMIYSLPQRFPPVNNWWEETFCLDHTHELFMNSGNPPSQTKGGKKLPVWNTLMNYS